MHQLILNISDNAYMDLKKIIENNPNIEIKEDTYNPSNDEFSINVDNALKTLKQIKNGDTKSFKAIDEHIKELKDNNDSRYIKI